MAGRRGKPEDTVLKLLQVEVMPWQGKARADMADRRDGSNLFPLVQAWLTDLGAIRAQCCTETR